MPLPPPPPVAWEDRQRSPGNWNWRPGTATFVDGAVELVSFTCQGRAIRIERNGATSGLTIRTTTLSRSLRVDEVLPANDPLLDAIVYSRGKWLVASAGQADLVLPPWPEIARTVEDCRA